MARSEQSALIVSQVRSVTQVVDLAKASNAVQVLSTGAGLRWPRESRAGRLDTSTTSKGLPSTDAHSRPERGFTPICTSSFRSASSSIPPDTNQLEGTHGSAGHSGIADVASGRISSGCPQIHLLGGPLARRCILDFRSDYRGFSVSNKRINAGGEVRFSGFVVDVDLKAMGAKPAPGAEYLVWVFLDGTLRSKTTAKTGSNGAFLFRLPVNNNASVGAYTVFVTIPNSPVNDGTVKSVRFEAVRPPMPDYSSVISDIKKAEKWGLLRSPSYLAYQWRFGFSMKTRKDGVICELAVLGGDLDIKYEVNTEKAAALGFGATFGAFGLAHLLNWFGAGTTGILAPWIGLGVPAATVGVPQFLESMTSNSATNTGLLGYLSFVVLRGEMERAGFADTTVGQVGTIRAAAFAHSQDGCFTAQSRLDELGTEAGHALTGAQPLIATFSLPSSSCIAGSKVYGFLAQSSGAIVDLDTDFPRSVGVGKGLVCLYSNSVPFDGANRYEAYYVNEPGFPVASLVPPVQKLQELAQNAWKSEWN